MPQKHTYTREEAPTNTGSLTRPARFNMRQTVEVHARTHSAFQRVRKATGLPADESYADVWEKKILLAVEHLLWHMDNSPKAVRDFVRSLFEPLPREDYLRVRYETLRLRFDPKARAEAKERETAAHQKQSVLFPQLAAATAS